MCLLKGHYEPAINDIVIKDIVSKDLYKKYQFKECGRLEKAYRQPSGEYVDDISMTLSLT